MTDETFDGKGNGNGNGHRVNWIAARAYYLALPPERRTYRAVGDRFHVTPQRVGQIAKREGWDQAVEELEQHEEREFQRIVRREGRARAERLARTLEVYDRANDLALELLPLTASGAIDVSRLGEAAPTLEQILRRIPGLFRMAELAAGEATDRVAIADVQPVLSAFARIAVLEAAPDRRAEVMRLLEAASAGLVALPAGEAA